MYRNLLIFNIFVYLTIFASINVTATCNLPKEWSGKWYQSKHAPLKTIDQTNFINRGECIETRQDKYVFYEKSENCYRCIFIMQKHINVLQYRASYCTEDPDFYNNCNNLTPESELVTIYRDNAVVEKCPLGGLYVMSQSSIHESNGYNDVRSYRNIFNNNQVSKDCASSNMKDSKIMECSDDSMLKLQFGKCVNMPTFIVQCMAHWTEGNTNYLIGRTFSNETQKPSYRCMAYTELPLNDESLNVRSGYHNDPDFIDLSSRSNGDFRKTTLQIHLSQFEFCRNIDNVIDEQFSYTFEKVAGSKDHVAPPISYERSPIKRQLDRFNVNNTHSIRSSHRLKSHRHSHRLNYCKFPRWLNKKWRDLKQTKLFMLDYRLDSLLILDEKNSVVINKYTCEKMKSKRSKSVKAIVKSLNGCSTGYQCMTIKKKSDFVLEIKFGKINYETADIDCNEDEYINKEFAFVETNFGVKCPLKTGLYEKLDSKTNSLHKALLLQNDSKHTLYKPRQQEPCKYLTQTQTLQVGCEADQQYSLRTKLCYPNQQDASYSTNLDVISHTQYTQIESEINLVCLAHWKHQGNQVIVSRTMTNEILCSIWTSSYNGKFLQLLAIDSNCDYKRIKEKRIDYGFIFLNSCANKARYSSSSFTSVIGEDETHSLKSYISSFALPTISTNRHLSIFIIKVIICNKFMRYVST